MLSTMTASAEKTAYTNFVVLLSFSAVPLLLAAATILMGWAYRRDLLRREQLSRVPAAEPQPGSTEDLPDGSQLRLILTDASADLGLAADQTLKESGDVTKRVRFAYLIAALAYAALSTTLLVQAAARWILEAVFVPTAAKRILETVPVQAAAKQILEAVLVPTAAKQILEVAFVQVAAKQIFGVVLMIAYLILAPQIVVVGWFIRTSLRQRLLTFLAYSLIGILLALLVAGSKGILHELAALIRLPHGMFSFLQTPIGLLVICPLAGLYFLRARRTQPFLALLAASLLYIGAGAVILILAVPHPYQKIIDEVSIRPWLILAGLANIVLGVILAGTLLRQSCSKRLLGIATLVVVAIVWGRMPLEGARVVLVILSGTAGSTLGVLFVWAVFKVFVWFQEQAHWLAPEILAAHFCWTYLTLCLLFYAWQLIALGYLSASGLLFLGCVAALAFHFAVLQVLLWRIRARRRSREPKRLLLLRVFGRADEPEDLLDALDDTWRRIGAVDLLGRSDVASRTLRSTTLEAFLLRRGDDQYLKTDEEVDRRLLDLRSEVEGDARYPVNGVYCYEDAWWQAFIRLAQNADAVLMDLRSFTSENRGSAWELDYLVKNTPLRRILLLVDYDPGRRELIKQKAQAALAHLPLDSPNTSDQKPELKYLIYHRRSKADRHKLSRLLLGAAGDSAAT